MVASARSLRLGRRRIVVCFSAQMCPKTLTETAVGQNYWLGNMTLGGADSSEIIIFAEK